MQQFVLYINFSTVLLMSVPGSGSLPPGREEGAGEYETGSGETDQNAGICPQTGEVRDLRRERFLFFSITTIFLLTLVGFSLFYCM